MNEKKMFFLYLLFPFCWSCQEVFEADLASSKVVLSSPMNNEISSSTNQAFYWQQVASSNKYEIQVVSPNFDSIASVIYDTVVYNNIISLSLMPGRYEWRVMASNSTSTTSFSDAWNLTVE
jgi:hypothetical protein